MRTVSHQLGNISRDRIYKKEPTENSGVEKHNNWNVKFAVGGQKI